MGLFEVVGEMERCSYFLSRREIRNYENRFTEKYRKVHILELPHKRSISIIYTTHDIYIRS